MSELLSNSRMAALKHVKDNEIERSMKDLYKICIDEDPTGGPVLVEMKKWFGDLTLNVMLMMIVGRKYSGEDDSSKRFRVGMRSFMRLMGIFVPGDAFPILRWFDIGGYRKQMRSTIKELDALFQGWYQEHKKKRASGESKGDEDFMDVLMTILEHEKISEYNNDTIIIATCLSLFSGSDTTMLTLTWILALLLNNRRVLKKAQDELDRHVG
ncbi:cytochrome P450, partial [Ralstonia pseudosolanacearum]|uniref:cytochrome P450 n=1 Tax=Ralstonia pseudosolanacearum TaxID=1310165 RepID=UPI003CE87CA1